MSFIVERSIILLTRKCNDNVEVTHGTGLVYRAMGFPPQFFTVLFALPRVTGYLAHWREQLTDPDVKIARPQQNYTVCPCTVMSGGSLFVSWLCCTLFRWLFEAGSKVHCMLHGLG